MISLILSSISPFDLISVETTSVVPFRDFLPRVASLTPNNAVEPAAEAR